MSASGPVDAAVLTIGTAPSLAMAMTYTVAAQTIGGVMSNAVGNEKSMQIFASAATMVICAMITKAGASQGGSGGTP